MSAVRCDRLGDVDSLSSKFGCCDANAVSRGSGKSCCWFGCKGHDEVGAFAGVGEDFEAAAVGFDESAGGGKAQTTAACFGGEVGREDFGEDVLGDARSGVDDVDLHGGDAVGWIARGDGADDEFFGRDSSPTACGVVHGLYSVDHEVEDGLLDVGDIERDDELSHGKVGAETHALGLGLGHEEVAEFVDDAVDISGVFVEAQFAGVIEEVLEDATEALDFAAESGDAALEALAFDVGDGGVAREFVDGFAQQLGVEADGAEGVFDFVSEAAGEAADFGEAFGSAGAAFGDLLAFEGAADLPARDDGHEGGADDKTQS